MLSMPRLLVGTVLFNTLLAGLLVLVRFGGTFAENVIYSNCIGLTVVGIYFAGRRLLWPLRRPPAPMLVGLVVVATLVGWLAGSALASALLSQPWQPGHAGGAVLAITAAASVIATFYFWNRERTAEIEHQAVEARLKLLQAQLEPHFLFNALANLDALIATDPKRARTMLGHLNCYLRATLMATRKDWSTLADEFALLSGYLEVQTIRMGPRLRHEVSLPPALATATVPPMLLQPLIENAIKHGLEPKVDGGEIRVSARKDGSNVFIEVADTGMGSGDTAGTGVGLDNVRERLAAVGGKLAYAKNPSGGVTVTLEVPQP
jgi:hypothetical protein